MKKIFLVFTILTAFFTNISFAAITPTPLKSGLTPTPTPANKISPTEDLDKQINDLKDRIASRVAQLNLVEKRGIIGKVTDVSDTQITLTDNDGNINFIDVDELTKFSSPDANSFGISDVTKGITVGVLGLYNKESRRILARFVDVLTLPEIISGAVSDINKADFSFVVISNENKEYTVEVETLTKSYTYSNADDGMIKSGFSKLNQGERVFVVGFFDAKDKSKIIASRIIRFPTLPVNPKISIAPTSQPTPTPTIKAQKKSTSQ